MRLVCMYCVTVASLSSARHFQIPDSDSGLAEERRRKDGALRIVSSNQVPLAETIILNVAMAFYDVCRHMRHAMVYEAVGSGVRTKETHFVYAFVVLEALVEALSEGGYMTVEEGENGRGHR